MSAAGAVQTKRSHFPDRPGGICKRADVANEIPSLRTGYHYTRRRHATADEDTMKFDRRNAIGKAGERFVESFVEEELQFAFRGIGAPDLGIDGEIELLDAARSTTGGLLKVQVKTTKRSLVGKKRIRVPFDEEHLDYFDSLTVPPILTVVSLHDRRIWWKPILHKENYRGDRGGWGIVLDGDKDALTRWSGVTLRMIGERSNAMIASYLLEEVDQQLADMDEAEEANAFDVVTLGSWAQTLSQIDRTMRDVRCLLRYERRYTEKITAIEANETSIRARIATRKSFFQERDQSELLNISRWGDED